MEQKAMKLPGTTLSCTVHLLNARKLHLRNGTEGDTAAPFPVQYMSQ
jgi:hypothetical protein